MARVRGQIKLDGKIGDMVFYKTRYGDIARRIGVVSKERRQKDPAYAATRDNNSEFGYGARMSKLMRRGVKVCCPHVETGTTHHRLNGLIRKVVQKDTVSERGKRVLTAENVTRLEGFTWKEALDLGNVLRGNYPLALDSTNGTAALSMGAFVPSTDVKVEDGATHVQLTLVLVAVDFGTNSQQNVCDRSGMIALTGNGSIAINLSCALSEFGGKVLFAGVGVQGYQLVGGEMMPLKERAVFEIGRAGIGGN